MAKDPRAQIAALEAGLPLPAGSAERFSGYGVMGLPFASGHVLALRRFPASSLGPGYSSVWHRSPAGEWTFYADVPPQQACARYFGAAAAAAITTEIQLAWTGPASLRVTMPALRFAWEFSLGRSQAAGLLGAVGRLLPEPAWRQPAVLAAMGKVAGLLLDLGRVGLQGRAPNGQQFMATPRQLWPIAQSRASLAGEAFGTPGFLHPQVRLGDFWIPQRGVLAIGQAYFEPFDGARHAAAGAAAGREPGA